MSSVLHCMCFKCQISHSEFVLIDPWQNKFKTASHSAFATSCMQEASKHKLKSKSLRHREVQKHVEVEVKVSEPMSSNGPVMGPEIGRSYVNVLTISLHINAWLYLMLHSSN